MKLRSVFATLACVFLFAMNAQAQFLTNGGTGASTFTGAQHNLGFYEVYLSADSATTVQSLVGSPLQIAIDTSQTWQFTAWLDATSSSNAGIEVGVTVPTGATLVAGAFGNSTGATAFSSDTINASATATAAYLTKTGGGGGQVVINGTVKTDATHSGSLMIDFLKATSGTATLKQGCYFRAIRTS